MLNGRLLKGRNRDMLHDSDPLTTCTAKPTHMLRMDIRADTKCNASTQFAFLLRFLLFYLFAAFCIWMLVCFLAILASRVTDQNENVDNMYGRKWNFSEVMFFYFCYSWPFTMVLCNYSSLVHISTFHSLHLLLAQDYSTHNMLGCNLNGPSQIHVQTSQHMLKDMKQGNKKLVK